MKHLLPLALIVLIAAVAAPAKAPRLSPKAQRGFTFAQAHCAVCHAVGRDALQSPEPGAPPFELIANKRGVTRTTLTVFLRDAHNYPEAMQFKLDRRAIDGLTSYMLTLRRPGYHPPI